ncbi:hypothetical protein NECAME_04983, partial [Necator americanus]
YTLSHRFQLRENSRTCSFLVSLHSLICISFITMCFVDVAVTDLGPTNDIYALLFRKELCFVVSPLFLIFYALNFLCRLDIVYDKAKKIRSSCVRKEPSRLTYVYVASMSFLKFIISPIRRRSIKGSHIDLPKILFDL